MRGLSSYPLTNSDTFLPSTCGWDIGAFLALKLVAIAIFRYAPYAFGCFFTKVAVSHNFRYSSSVFTKYGLSIVYSYCIGNEKSAIFDD